MTQKEILLEILDRVKAIESYVRSSAPPDIITISCDGSVIKNPGGPCAVGVVIQSPGGESIEIGHKVPSTTNNEAEIDAIYVGLNSILGLNKSPDIPIEVISDSMIIVNGLNKESSLKNERLKKKRDMIIELVNRSGAKVTYKWAPRNSTVALDRANFLAQKANGVKNPGQ